MHLTAGNTLWTLLHVNPPQNMEDVNHLMDTTLATATYSACAAIHSTLNISPGALVFHRDMLLDIPLIADLYLLRQQRQALIDRNLMVANQKRFSHNYQPNDYVLELLYKPGKLDPQARGPYQVVSVHTNGTITIQCTPFVQERISIRHVHPYCQ